MSLCRAAKDAEPTSGPMSKYSKGPTVRDNPSKPSDPKEVQSTRRADSHDYGGLLGAWLDLELCMPTTFVSPE